MTLSAALLRLLLALTLAVGGIGNAHAAAAMALMHAGAAEASAPSAPAADAAASEGCEHPPAHGHDARTPVADVENEQAGADCCEGDACRSICSHGHAAALLAPSRATPPSPGSAEAAARAPFGPAPALPPLIRPPIA